MAQESFSPNRVNRARLLAVAFASLLMLLTIPISTSTAFQITSSGLADATVLIIRHAEKPDSGAGLSPAGEARAQAYVGYFQHLTLNGTEFRPDTLIATADSKNSARERLKPAESPCLSPGITAPCRRSLRRSAATRTQSCPMGTGRTTFSMLSLRFATVMTGNSFRDPSSSFAKISQSRRD
jgi:hypothetical protein